ncbi:hypothetical protein AB0A99_20630 [Streptomyces fradiae]|uniref:hypothetical protein n=1 Tax=Streptomyces fradiae TaxID=1906 RepID=UPI0034110D12
MKLVGFFREMELQLDGEPPESIHDHLTSHAPYHKERVITYLKSGHPIFDITELTIDVIGARFHVAGGSSLLTDGENVWREDLASYVEHYAVALPADFLQFMKAHGFAVPPVSRDRLIEVSASAQNQLGFRPTRGSGPRRQQGNI